MKRVELMSPAGSFESLRAAIQGGADAVYFGAGHLNMRARAANTFLPEDLGEIRKICSDSNVKTYLTLNTVMYDHDLPFMKKIIELAKENRIDAVIGSDQAVLLYAKQTGMPVHISTQANVSNIETVKFYSAYANTIVLARELSLMQVKEIGSQIIRDRIKGPSGKLIELEVFAHGALCMAISGKCYLSLHSHNASANRGACVQNCRRAYEVKDKEEGIEYAIENEYIMSSKDLCTIDLINRLIGAGISILKIEGRGRSADYVFSVTKCYREAIDAYYDGTYGDKARMLEWKKELAGAFNRGFWEGYYLGKTIGEWTDEYGSKATKKKIYIGKGVHYFSHKKVAEFKLESSELTKGNNILITGPSTGVIHQKVEELWVSGEVVNTVKRGEVFSMPLEKKIRSSDKLYKITSADDTDHSTP